MRHSSKKNYYGLYVPRDGIGAGQLKVAGDETVLKLVSKVERSEPGGEFIDHHGFLTDGARATLLQCIPIGRIDHRWGEDAQCELDLFPHYIVVGETFVNSDDAVVRALHYHFENVDSLVNGFGTFGTIRPDRDEFLNILEANHKRHEEIAEKHGWPKRAFDATIGDNPLLLYYNGVREIARCEADLGLVTMTNRITHGMGSSCGVGIDNAITVRVEFSSPKTTAHSLRALWTLHSFFELCLGRQQRYLRIEAELTNQDPDENGNPPSPSEILWSLCNERVIGETKQTSYGDILLDPGAQQSQFARVLSGWLNSSPEMADARNRFATAFYSSAYGIDRIVGAANMFDLLPESHAPAKIEPDPQTSGAVEECRKLFRALRKNFARQSVLSALGRIGTASLRDKVYHRADLIIARDGAKFADLHLPCSQAVLCRNHYVHGSPAAFNYREEINTFAFLTDTLEFVFAVSDLLELGWDYEAWRTKGSSLTHAFGSYVINYDENLRRLKALLGK